MNNYHQNVQKGHRNKVFRPTDFYISAQSCQKRPYFGAHSVRETPVLIPNTEVKTDCGDYTATSGKLARCRII